MVLCPTTRYHFFLTEASVKQDPCPSCQILLSSNRTLHAHIAPQKALCWWPVKLRVAFVYNTQRPEILIVSYLQATLYALNEVFDQALISRIAGDHILVRAYEDCWVRNAQCGARQCVITGGP